MEWGIAQTYLTARRSSLGEQMIKLPEANPIRWGIVGAGMISADFVNAAHTLPEAEHKVVTIASSSLDRGKEFARIHNIPHYCSYEALANNKDVDVVYIGSINSAHYDQIKMFLKAGKHVLCEKPMCLNVKRTKDVIHMAHERNLFLMEGIWSRFFPIYTRIKEEIRKGTIGDVMSVQVSMGFAVHERNRTKFRKFGGGGLYDFGIYPIQFANWVLGKPDKMTCSGHLSEEGVDESASLTLLYPQSRIASVLLTTKSDLPNEAHIFGTKGQIKLWPVYAPVHLELPSGIEEHPVPATTKTTNYMNATGLAYEAQAVRKCLLEGKMQCNRVPHSETELIAKLLHQSRLELGVKFDQDKDKDITAHHTEVIAESVFP
ncbi:PREDICTED: trans-1,2-dihydrobenzene-1,2-diol dehydrogenase-like isoform X2 [Priapulus caudatus]|uniref:Trans-1,2-dihydrobenzene-1,2-diol dehydrogenase n=1 Tax=Priapulus caudatus TaxID=37621 RepID=A0ABM1DQK1_PRICU|nr:PREDICTED: trans-1,2-dihydrobenzene-1,2-diol dehydrogenase-like isoform X2 [Priapulus caudatus]